MKPEPEQSPARYVALSLSGGGFRATFFHLGVLRYFYDVGLLQKIRHISAVSGGSIVAASLVQNWEDVHAKGGFERFVAAIIAFTETDVRNRALRRWPLLYPFSLLPFKLPMGLTQYLAYRYGKSLYRNARLEELGGGGAPDLRLLCSNLSRPDCLASFSKNGFHALRYNEEAGAWTEDSVPTQFPKIGQAVAASSCLPGFFPPMRLDAGSLEVDRRQFIGREYLVDGGVFDNMGLLSLRFYRERHNCSVSICSDAGAIPDHTAKAFRGAFLPALRVMDILFERVRHHELTAVPDRLAPDSESKATEHCHIPIRDMVPDEVLSQNVQHRCARIRTDMDRFSEDEIRALVRHGQNVARLHTKDRLGVDPPADYGAWDPFGRSDKVDLDSLESSKRRRVRLGRDRIWLLYGAVLAVALAAIIYAWLIAPRFDHVVFSNLDGAPGRVDPANPGFVTEVRRIENDLRHEVGVDRSRFDEIRLSPSVQDVTMTVRRVSPKARYFVYTSASDRALNEHFVLTDHPYEVRHRVEGNFLLTDLKHVTTVIIDTEGRSLNLPFQIKARVVRFNAYQAENENYVGALVRDNVQRLELVTTVPDEKRLTVPPVLKYRRIDESNLKPWGNEGLVLEVGGNAFMWAIDSPERSHLYIATMLWADRQADRPVRKGRSPVK